MGIGTRGSFAGAKVCTKVVDNTKKKTLLAGIKQHVPAATAIFTDALKSYAGLHDFQHELVDRAIEHVRGEVHTNGMENFWSLVKRAEGDLHQR